MAKRMKLSRGASRRGFRRNAGIHPKNSIASPMRGGIRL